MDANAFSGPRVVELAQWVFVPVAGALLADWGADVTVSDPTFPQFPVPRPRRPPRRRASAFPHQKRRVACRGRRPRHGIPLPAHDEVRLGERLGVLYGFCPWVITLLVARPVTGTLLLRPGTAVADYDAVADARSRS